MDFSLGRPTTGFDPFVLLLKGEEASVSFRVFDCCWLIAPLKLGVGGKTTPSLNLNELKAARGRDFVNISASCF